MIQFRGIVHQIGKRQIIALPDDVSAALPSRGQVAATVVIGGTERGAVIEPDGRRGHWLPADDLELNDGQPVNVAVSPLPNWPEPTLPDDLSAALDEAPEIWATWSDITPMARWEWVRWINATRNPDTRAKRIEVAIDKMRKGNRRPCCFDRSACTDPELARSGKLIQIS